MTVLESVQVVESGLQVLNWPDSLSVELGFWIPIVRGFRVPWAQDSGFHKKKIPGFWNPDTLTWGDFCVKCKR